MSTAPVKQAKNDVSKYGDNATNPYKDSVSKEKYQAERDRLLKK